MAVKHTRARTLTNFLPGRPGQAVLRGPLIHGAPLTNRVDVTSPALVFGDSVAVKLIAGGWMRASYNYNGNPIATSMTGVAPTNSIRESNQSTRHESFTYGPNADNAGGVLKWDGSTAVPVVLANGPLASSAVASHLGRLFVLGGRVPGTGNGSTLYRDRLYWTVPGWNGTDTLASWQDNVSGLTNQISLGEDSTNPSLAIVPFRNSLLIIRRKSIQELIGSSPASWSVRTVAHTGCANARTITLDDSGVYFQTTRGFARYDGAEIRPLAGAIADFAYASAPDTVAAGVIVDSDYLSFSFSGAYWLLYHMPSGTWSRVITSCFATGSVPEFMVAVASGVLVFGQAVVLALDYLVNPEVAADLGVALGWEYTSPSGVSYPAVTVSPLIPLSSPSAKSQLLRTIADIRYKGTNVGNTMTMSLLDAAGNTIGTPTTIQPNSAGTLQRVVQDMPIELDYVAVKWSFTASDTTNIKQVAIQSAWLDVRAAQKRTG